MKYLPRIVVVFVLGVGLLVRAPAGTQESHRHLSTAGASGLLKASNLDSARTALTDATARANEIKDPLQQSSALQEIVRVQIKAGNLAGAQQVASTIPDSDRRARAYADVAYARASSGDSAGAYAVADEVTRGEATGLKLTLAPEQQRAYRNSVLKAIASAQASRGDVQGVRDTAAKAGANQGAANEFLRLAARAQVKSGDAAGAEKSFTEYLRSMPDAGVTADISVQALALLCAAQIEVGDLAGAQATAERVRNGATEATLLADIAAAQSNPTLKSGSSETGSGAGTVKDDADAGAKNVAKALELANAYRDLSGFDKSNALLKIVAAQSDLRDFQGALQTAQKISDGFAKNQALTLIAVSQAKAGDIAGAQQTANGIVNDASAKNREDALAEVAIALADSGDIAGAEKTENLLPMDYDVSAVSAELAIGQAQAGDIKRALATVDHLNEHDRRGWRFKISAVNSIAKVQGRTGDVTGARTWISTSGSSELEASALTGLAEGLIEADSKKPQVATRR